MQDTKPTANELMRKAELYDKPVEIPGKYPLRTVLAEISNNLWSKG